MRWIKKVAVLAATGVALGAGITAASTVAAPAPAYAIDFCKEPVPSPPKRSAAGMLSITPESPPTGNPFEDPRIPIADVYGYSWTWKLYDTGVACQTQSDLGSVLNTGQAQLVMDYASAWTALLGLMEKLAKDFGLEWFTNWMAEFIEKVIRPMLWGGMSPNGQLIGLMPMAAIALGLFVAWKARKAQFSDAMRALLIFVGCVALAAWTLLVPTTAAGMLDGGVRATASIAGASFNASLTDGVNRQALYRAWLAGQFGDPDSQIAKDYGPRTLAATHYTWAEWAEADADPEAAKRIIEKKQADYKTIAQEVEEASPAAYEHFRGKNDRVAPALFGFISGALMGLFAMVAYFMIILARWVMQGLVIFAPLAATVGLLPRGMGPLMKLWQFFTAALVAVFKFTLAAGAMATVLGLMATLHPAAALISMTVATVLAFMLLKPAHAFKSLTPGLDPNRSYTGDLAKLALKIGGLAAGGAAGGVAAAKVIDATSKDDPDQHQEEVYRKELGAGGPGPREKVDLSTPPTVPSPTFTKVPGTNRHVITQLPDADPSKPGVLGMGPNGWQGVLPRQELPAGPGGSDGSVLNLNTKLETKLEITAGPEGKTEAKQATKVSGGPEVGSEVLVGEVVSVADSAPSGVYRRPDIVDAEGVEGPGGKSPGEPSRVSDAPAGELMLYESARS